jgi:hypothetical protein
MLLYAAAAPAAASCSFVPTKLFPKFVETAILDSWDFPANKMLNNEYRPDFKVRYQGSSRDVSSFPVLQGEAAAAVHNTAMEAYELKRWTLKGVAQAASAAEAVGTVRHNFSGVFDQQAVSRPGSSPRWAYVAAAAVATDAAAPQPAAEVAAKRSTAPFAALHSMAQGGGAVAEAAEALGDVLMRLTLDSSKKLMTELTGQRPARDAKATELKVSRWLAV